MVFYDIEWRNDKFEHQKTKENETKKVILKSSTQNSPISANIGKTRPQPHY